MSWTKRRFDAPQEDSQFYRSSFRQLSDIQQRQVGAILGAAVADAGVREFDRMSLESLQESVQSDRQGVWETSAQCLGDQELLFPSPVVPRCGPGSAKLRSADEGTMDERDPRLHHSLSLLFVQELLAALCRGRTMPSVDEVAHRWVRLAEANVDAFRGVHGTADHVAASLVPMACLYPWGSDAALDGCCRPLAEFLTSDNPHSTQHRSSFATAGNGRDAVDSEVLLTEPSATQDPSDHSSSRVAVLEGALIVQSVLLRCLQSNPNPLLNTALQLRRPKESHAVLPAEYRKFVPGFVGEAMGASPPLLPFQQLQPQQQQHQVSDAAVLGESDLDRVASVLGVACTARSFAAGVRAVARQHALTQVARGGRSPRVAMGASAVVAGAILGARHGVRDIPLPWISATHRHREIGTLSIALSQWSWNPMR